MQRWRTANVGDDRRAGPRTTPPNKLSEVERKKVIAVANSPEFRDLSVRQIVPRLADQGEYIASESTFYRVLKAAGLDTHRDASKPATRKRPDELVATGPDQVWTWDITYLKSPIRGSFYYLYMIVDVFSRKIVGAAVHDRESSKLAAELVERSTLTASAQPLVLHSDNGAPMKGATLLETLRQLGIACSFSRPSVSNDNAYSEALFRTLKYRPDYPDGPFAGISEASDWVVGFERWYNEQHLHSAIRFVTPAQRHSGADCAILKARTRVYQQARRRNPNRWSKGIRSWERPGSVRLNPPRAPGRTAA